MSEKDLNNLWKYLSSLPLTDENKDWLVQNLKESETDHDKKANPSDKRVSLDSVRKEKLGDWSLDIAKYIFTAVVIARWFNNSEPWQLYDYILPLLVVTFTVAFGLYLTGKKQIDNK